MKNILPLLETRGQDNYSSNFPGQVIACSSGNLAVLETFPLILTLLARDPLHWIAPVLSIVLVLSRAIAAEPSLTQTDLFQAGLGGYEIYRIPGIVVTGKGMLLAYCEARKSGRGDWGPIDLLLRRSTDGGRSWSAPLPLARVEGPKKKNPVALKQKLANPDPADRHGSFPVLPGIHALLLPAQRR